MFEVKQRHLEILVFRLFASVKRSGGNGNSPGHFPNSLGTTVQVQVQVSFIYLLDSTHQCYSFLSPYHTSALLCTETSCLLEVHRLVLLSLTETCTQAQHRLRKSNCADTTYPNSHLTSHSLLFAFLLFNNLRGISLLSLRIQAG